jgi:hypothetical protein
MFHLGPGRAPASTMINFGATVPATSSLRFFARVANLLDRHDATAAQLGPTGFDAGGRFVAQPFPADSQGRFPVRRSTFYAPGAARLVSLGLRHAFD